MKRAFMGTREDSGSHLQKLLRRGGQYGGESGGQLSAFVGEVVTMPVGDLADQAVIAQESEMAGNASGKLLVGSAGAPWPGA